MEIVLPPTDIRPEKFAKELSPEQLSQALRERWELRYAHPKAFVIDEAFHQAFARENFHPQLRLLSICDEVGRAIFNRTVSVDLRTDRQEDFSGIHSAEQTGSMAWGVAYTWHQNKKEYWVPMAATTISYLNPHFMKHVAAFQLLGEDELLFTAIAQELNLGAGALRGGWTYRFRNMAQVQANLPQFSDLPDLNFNTVLDMTQLTVLNRRAVVNTILHQGYSDETLLYSEQRGMLPDLFHTGYYHAHGFQGVFGETISANCEISLAEILFLELNDPELTDKLRAIQVEYVAKSEADPLDRAYMRLRALEQILDIDLCKLDASALAHGYPLKKFIKKNHPQSSAIQEIYRRLGIKSEHQNLIAFGRLGKIFAAQLSDLQLS